MEFRYEEGGYEVLETDASREQIARTLRSMNGDDRTYCSLSVHDGWYIQCTGTAEAMLIEMRVPHVEGFRHYAIGYTVELTQKTGPFKLRTRRERSVSETFKAETAEELFRSFAETQGIPPTFAKRDMTDFFD